MELKWLDDYTALIELGSFSRAAESRFVTQPAFSRRIRSLEDWLGVSLVRELDNGDLVCLNDSCPRVELSVRLYRLRQSRSQSARQFWQYLHDMHNQNPSPVG